MTTSRPTLAMQPYLERIEQLRSLRDRGSDSEKLKRHIREDPALNPSIRPIFS